MDPTQATTAILTPWAQYGIVGSVVVALGFTTVFLGMWIKSLVNRQLDRLERDLDEKNQAYERLVESIRKREKDPQ
ncbi:hypothetical protein SAMN02745126_04012 [Enhydrobacter aerosaccus]|uniref:Uncharacterized protein n=1 Tax=Enhydrobacter aerosaccus TaxID=225324 RepID=A0A1T4RPD2_9HYPH|nr:hypothetical protein [Enhydrobacter aerosaccus]SKA17875.1 hypothetical protein SAMN02745126_04012 [Enhydrobacter aerosaccus]